MLVDGFVCDQGLLHVVGADAMSLFAVFANGKHGWRLRQMKGWRKGPAVCAPPALSLEVHQKLTCHPFPAPFPCAGVMSNGGLNSSMPAAGRLQLHADGCAWHATQASMHPLSSA